MIKCILIFNSSAGLMLKGFLCLILNGVVKCKIMWKNGMNLNYEKLLYNWMLKKKIYYIWFVKYKE